MNWISNIQNPNDSTTAHTWYDERGLAWRLPYNDPRIIAFDRQLLQNRIIGEPQVPPGSDITLEQLKAMGLVGLYEPS